MYTKSDLIAHLKKSNIEPHGTLKVHISYKAVGDVDGRGDTVLDALMEYMHGGLLVLPTHTWNWRIVNSENPVSDALYTKSCVGAITELFRHRPGVHRSLHPSHSVAAFGKEAAAFVEGDERVNTPCGFGGCYYKLWERDAQILMIGVGLNRCTFIHGSEEWDGAENILSAEPRERYVINHAGQRLYAPQYYHISRTGSETFPKLEAPALARGILHKGKFGDADTRLMRAKALRELVAEFLKEDASYLHRY